MNVAENLRLHKITIGVLKIIPMLLAAYVTIVENTYYNCTGGSNLPPLSFYLY